MCEFVNGSALYPLYDSADHSSSLKLGSLTLWKNEVSGTSQGVFEDKLRTYIYKSHMAWLADTICLINARSLLWFWLSVQRNGCSNVR